MKRSYRELPEGSTTITAAGGTGVSGLLGVAFIVLKLIGLINWSWWWVLAPFWIPFALSCVLAVIIAVGYLLYSIFE